MRYTNVFCGRYTLATGTRVIAWFNIVLYVINIVFNILAVDIVKSYKENVDEDIDYNRNQLLIFHYICLVFGVVTVLSSAIFLVKMSESEDFMQFMVKWNVIRCLFVFGAIIYVCAEMDHILTVTISSVLLVIDLCSSTYFTGVMSSYVKQLEDPSGQVYTSHENSNRGPAVCLVSLKKTSQTENKGEYVNEVSNSSSPLPEQGNTAIPDDTTGTVNVAVDAESKKDVTEEKNHNSITTTNNDIASTVNTVEPQNSSPSTANDEDGEKTNEPAPQSSLKGIPREENTITESRGKPDSNNTHEKDDSELEEKITYPDKETTSPDSNEPYRNNDNDTRDVANNEKSSIDIPADPDIEVKSEKREIQKPENEVDSEIQENERNETEDSEKSSEVKGIENPAVDVSEIEPPSVVVIPANPDQEVEINVNIR